MLPVGILAGAAIGAATTYVYKDETSRQWLGEMSAKVKDGTQSLMSKFKKEDEDVVQEAVDATAAEIDEVEAEVAEVVAETASEIEDGMQQK